MNSAAVFGKGIVRLNPNTLEPACSERWRDVLWVVLTFTGTLCVVHLETSIKVLLTNFVFLSRPFIRCIFVIFPQPCDVRLPFILTLVLFNKGWNSLCRWKKPPLSIQRLIVFHSDVTPSFTHLYSFVNYYRNKVNIVRFYSITLAPSSN